MTLLKHLKRPTLLPYEQLFIQTYHHHKQLIPEQHVGEVNPMYQLIHDICNTSHLHKKTDHSPRNPTCTNSKTKEAGHIQ